MRNRTLRRALSPVLAALLAVCLGGTALCAPAPGADKADDMLYPFTGANGKYGYMDRAGKVVVKPRYDTAGPFSEGLAFVFDDDKYQGGYINAKGKMVFKIPWEISRPFQDGYALANGDDDDVMPYYDRKGNEPFAFGYAESFSGGHAVVSENFDPAYADADGENIYFFIDTAGKPAGALRFTYKPRSFRGGYAGVRQGDKWGLINSRFELVIPYRYESVGFYGDGLINAKLNGKWGAVDAAGNVVIDFVYDDMESFHEGFAVVQVGEKYGVIDTAGNLLVAAKYDAVENFSEGLAAVCSNGKWGFVDTAGKLVVKLKYEGVGDCRGGLIPVGGKQIRNTYSGSAHYRTPAKITHYITPAGEVVQPKS